MPAKTGPNLLKTEMLGLALNNPVIIAASELTGNVRQIRSLLQMGVGAVITKTIYNGTDASTYGKIIKNETGLLNSATYSKLPKSDWVTAMKEFMAEQLPVIPSIYADTPQQLTELAVELEEAGCRAFELGISCPNVREGESTKRVHEFTSVLCKNVSVPVAVKLAAADSVEERVRAVLDAGAEAISLSDALPGIMVDENGHLLFGGPAGYSGRGIKPLVQNAIYRIRKAGIHCPIMGIGGIETAADVLEYLYLGTSAVQICSSLYIRGISHAGNILSDLRSHVEKRQDSIEKIIGRAFHNENIAWGE